MKIQETLVKVLNGVEQLERKFTGNTLPAEKIMDLCEKCDPNTERSLWNNMIICDKCWSFIKTILIKVKESK